MTSPAFGFIINEDDTDAPAPVIADMSIVGLVLPSQDANPAIFPLNQPVSVNSGDPTVLAAMGTGPLYGAVTRINAQLADLQVSAQAIIVRVPMAFGSDGITENVAGTIANIIGSSAAQSGLFALLQAPQVCNLTPRLIGAPGYTGYTPYAVASVAVQNQGANYTAPVVTFTPAGATATATVGNAGVQAVAAATIGNPGVQATAQATLGTGSSSGQVASVAVVAGGQAYRSVPAVTFSGGGGTGAAAHAVLTAGVVTGIVVDTAGTGYTSAPTVALAAPATGQITGVSISNGGQAYAAAPSVAFSGGGGTGAAAHSVVANGIVTGMVIDNPGSGYTSAPTVTLGVPAPGEITAINLTSPGAYPPGTTVTVAITDSNGGSGAGATATLTLEQLANPVCAALPAILARLLGHAIVGGPGLAKQDALNWRTTLSGSGRLIPQDDYEIVAAGSGTAYVDGAARSLGLAVRTDFQNGGLPFHSWANTPVQGALGLKRIDSFSLLDGATDGQELLTAGIGVTVRGDASDTSLDSSGYIAVSLNNDNTDANLNFYNKTRGRDFIDLTLIRTIRTVLGKTNITPFAVQSVLTAMAQIMIPLQARGCCVGYTVGFNAADNSTAALRAGKFTVYDNSEEPAPICVVTINRALDQAALTAELATLAALTPTVTS